MNSAETKVSPMEEDEHYIDESFLTLLLCLQRMRMEFPTEILYMLHEWIVVYKCENCNCLRSSIKANWDDMLACHFCCKDIVCGIGACATSFWNCSECNTMSCDACLDETTTKCGLCDVTFCECLADYDDDNDRFLCPNCAEAAEEEDDA